MSTPTADIGPIPGEPTGIRELAGKYTSTAQAIRDSILMLRGVQDAAASEQSDAVDALAEKIGNAQARLGDLEGRYEVAGSELTTFAGELEEAQRLATAATSARDTAAAEAARLERRYEDARDEVDRATDEIARQEAQRRATGISQHLSSVQQDLASAGQTHAMALEMVRAAGDRAAEAISGVIGSDGLNDSRWDNFMGWVSDNAGFLTNLKNVLGAITAVIGIISIFCPLLAPLAFAFGAMTALVSFSLAAAGEGSWLDFGLDMVGVLTFGVGAVAARGVSLGLRGMQTMRGLTYNRQITTILQRVVRPVATRRHAIRVVGDSFESVLPAGQQLITRTPGVMKRAWLEASGVGVDQFTTIRQATTLGQNSFRSAFVEGLTEMGAGAYRVTEGVGAGLDVVGLGTLGLEQWDMRADNLPDVPGLDQVAAAWTDVQSATTAPMSSPGWHPNPAATP